MSRITLWVAGYALTTKHLIQWANHHKIRTPEFLQENPRDVGDQVWLYFESHGLLDFSDLASVTVPVGGGRREKRTLFITGMAITETEPSAPIPHPDIKPDCVKRRILFPEEMIHPNTDDWKDICFAILPWPKNQGCTETVARLIYAEIEKLYPGDRRKRTFFERTLGIPRIHIGNGKTIAVDKFYEIRNQVEEDLRRKALERDEAMPLPTAA